MVRCASDTRLVPLEVQCHCTMVPVLMYMVYGSSPGVVQDSTVDCTVRTCTGTRYFRSYGTVQYYSNNTVGSYILRGTCIRILDLVQLCTVPVQYCSGRIEVAI